MFAYYPYGEERTSTADGREKFGTYTRDSGTQDYADQRYYNVGRGRFGTPDPYQASAGAGDPGSWNRYVYVMGDPVNNLDPGGTNAIAASALAGIFDTFDVNTGMFKFTVTGYLTPDPPTTGGPQTPGGAMTNLDRAVLGGNGNDIPMPETTSAEPPPTTTGPNVDCHSIASHASDGALSTFFSYLSDALGNIDQHRDGGGTVAGMFVNFVSGTASDVTFSSTSVQSKQMATSVLVAAAVNQYLTDGYSSGYMHFTIGDALTSLPNPTQSFVGSFNWQIATDPMAGTMSIAITNTTGVYSGSYHRMRDNPFGSGVRTPLHNFNQTFLLNVPCR